MKETINMLFKKSALVIAASLLALGAAHAAPPSINANLNVSINVTASSAATACTIGGMMPMSPLSVSATYTSGAAAAEVVAGGYATLTCNGTDAVPYTIGASQGDNSNGSSRRALFSGNYVDYQLHLQAMWPAVGAIWDAATPVFGGGAVMTGSTTPSGASSTANLNFSVKVPANQTAPSGTYTDVVVLTATF